jgi:hypothetical protein
MLCGMRLESLEPYSIKDLGVLRHSFQFNLEAAFAVFAPWCNYCRQIRNPGKSGEKP